MYIVTGGAGFIGSAVIWRLNQAGISNILIVDDLGSTEKWRNLVNLSYQDCIRSDEFLGRTQKRSLPEPLEAVIHMGACSDTTERNADFMLDNNLHYSQEVCRYALSVGARFINASSAATYGDGSRGFSDRPDALPELKPLNIYGYSKHLFDLWASREGLLPHLASLKFFNVFGPNEYHKGEMRSMVCKAFEQIRDTGRIRLFRSDHPQYADGGQMRDFIYVKDCVEIVYQLLEYPRMNGLFNVGSGQARSWNDLALAVFSALEREAAIEYIDMPDNLKGCYQQYTQADMGWLAGTPFGRRMNTLEDAVRDYVCKYLLAADKYL